MDIQACIYELMVLLAKQNNRPRIIELIDSIKQWMEKGGYYPIVNRFESMDVFGIHEKTR